MDTENYLNTIHNTQYTITKYKLFIYLFGFVEKFPYKFLNKNIAVTKYKFIYFI